MIWRCVSNVFGVSLLLLLGFVLAVPAPIASAPAAVAVVEPQPAAPVDPAPVAVPGPVEPRVVGAVPCGEAATPAPFSPDPGRPPVLRLDVAVRVPTPPACLADAAPQPADEEPQWPAEAAATEPVGPARPDPVVAPVVPPVSAVVAVEPVLPACHDDCVTLTEFLADKLEGLAAVISAPAAESTPASPQPPEETAWALLDEAAPVPSASPVLV